MTYDVDDVSLTVLLLTAMAASAHRPCSIHGPSLCKVRYMQWEFCTFVCLSVTLSRTVLKWLTMSNGFHHRVESSLIILVFRHKIPS